HFGLAGAPHMPQCPMIRFPRTEILRSGMEHPLRLSVGQRGLDRGDRRARNFVLHRKHVDEVAIIRLALTSYTALPDVAHANADAIACGSSLRCKARTASDGRQAAVA